MDDVAIYDRTMSDGLLAPYVAAKGVATLA